MQLGSDPHVILENIAIYINKPDFKPNSFIKVLAQYLLDMRECCHNYQKTLDENYHLHGQLEKVKAGYIYNIVHKYQFGDLGKYAPKPVECTCGYAFWPKKINNGTKVILSCPNIKCGYGLDVPEKFIEQAKQEMEGDGLEWF